MAESKMVILRNIWIDLDHISHVPLFRPIIEELHRRGVETLVTARDFAQTVALLEMWNIDHAKIGRHGGSSKVGKVLKGLLFNT